MGWKEFAKDYLTFTRKERIGLLIIIIIVPGIWIFPGLVSRGRSKPIPGDTSWIIAAKKLQHEESYSQNDSKKGDENINELVYEKPVTGYAAGLKTELFYFDPNSLSFEGWKRLGMREKTITTIQKYTSKGGHFYKAEDLKRIYGIHPDEYARLEPYIKIETANNQKSLNESYTKKEFSKPVNNYPKYDLVDVNAADTSAFIALPGIGSKLAARIVNFRDKLGGFYSIGQVSETYGLPDSVFQKIKSYLRLENNSVKKININTATKDEMKSHPYLRWNLANAIVEYRNQHGNYSSPDDLKKITAITEEIFAKIRPYVLVE
jgi:competence protein ComEA